MANEPMTLVERLRNPTYVSTGTWSEPILQTGRTRGDLAEAADEIERLQKELDRIQFPTQA